MKLHHQTSSDVPKISSTDPNPTETEFNLNARRYNMQQYCHCAGWVFSRFFPHSKPYHFSTFVNFRFNAIQFSHNHNYPIFLLH